MADSRVSGARARERRSVDARGFDDRRRRNRRRMPGARETMGPSPPLALAVLVVTPFAYRLIFARHGETAYNAENRLQGQLDIPLNARGREQARSIGRALQARVGAEIAQLEAAGAFIASPLGRARETMEIARAAIDLPPGRYRVNAALKEISFGAWEGL